MNIQRSLIAAAVLATGFVVAVPAMADHETTTTVVKTTKHHYVYYGDHQIYFAPETKTYYWQTNGTWQTGVTLPVESQAYIKSGGMEIDLDTDRPYDRNESVIVQYKHMHDSGDKHDGDDKQDGDQQ